MTPSRTTNSNLDRPFVINHVFDVFDVPNIGGLGLPMPSPPPYDPWTRTTYRAIEKKLVKEFLARFCRSSQLCQEFDRKLSLWLSAPPPPSTPLTQENELSFPKYFAAFLITFKPSLFQIDFAYFMVFCDGTVSWGLSKNRGNLSTSLQIA